MDGENHFVIAPQPGGSFTYAKASYQSICGTVESGWKKAEGGNALTVTIPCNTTATVLLPDGRSSAVGTGTHEFSW